MNLDPRSWRPSPLFPPARGAGGAGLALGALLISLAAVAAMAWLSADLRARPAIAARLAGGATIAVSGASARAGLESLEASAWRAREILARTPGVRSAQVLAPAPGDKGIAAAMGAGEGPSRLIALTFMPGARPSPSALRTELARESLAGVADDHAPVSGPVERAVNFDAAALAGAGVLLISVFILLTAATVGERTRRLAPRITLLSGLGMTDRSILITLVRPVIWAIGVASIAGGAIALLVIRFAGPRISGIAPVIPAPAALDLILAAAWPLVAITLSVLIAVMTGRSRLRRIAP